jgi:hypothetical protein
VTEDKNRQPPTTEKKPANHVELEPLETADELRARLKKLYPDLTDAELDFFL